MFCSGRLCQCSYVPFLFSVQWRLVGGEKPIEGRIEVKYQGDWGSVCGDEMWSLTDAKVFCRSVGLPEATYALRYREFGRITGSVWMNGLKCHGGEVSLADCTYNDWVDQRDSCYYSANAVCGKPEGTTRVEHCQQCYQSSH